MAPLPPPPCLPPDAAKERCRRRADVPCEEEAVPEAWQSSQQSQGAHGAAESDRGLAGRGRKCPALCLACAAALLLPSCLNANWNIGERIRSGGEVRLGVNVREPLENKEYHTNRLDIRLAPEVSYVRDIPWVDVQLLDPREIVLFADMERTLVRDMTPTGRIVVAETSFNAGPAFQRELPALPDGCYTTQAKPNPQDITTDTLGTLAYQSRPSFWCRAAAAPFDYLVDPALSATTTAVAGIPTACFLAVYIPLYCLINGVPK